MGKSLIIKGADFSAVAVTHISILDITISKSGLVTILTDSSNYIYYTTDGTSPTTTSTRYTTPFVVTVGTTVKAILRFADGTISETVSKTYITLDYQLSNAKMIVGLGFGSTVSGYVTTSPMNTRAIVLTNISQNMLPCLPSADVEYNYVIKIPDGITSIKEKHTNSGFGVAVATVSTKNNTFTPGIWYNQANEDHIIDITGKTHLAISIRKPDESEMPSTATLADVGLSLTDNS